MATAAQVQSLYLAYFGRPADPEGLAYWVTQNASSTQSEVANAFALSPEYEASVAGKTSTQIVADYYQRLFNRLPDSAGLTYWVQQLNSGALSTQSLGLALVTAAQSQTGTPDSIAVASKTKAADEFTAEVAKTSAGILAYSGVNGLLVGTTFLSPVVSPATVPTPAQTTATVDALIIANGGGSSSTLALSIFSDVFTSTTGVRIVGLTSEQVPFRFNGSNQVVNAGPGTVTNQVVLPGVLPSDTLSDPSTIDNDTINIAPGNYTVSGANPFSATTNVRFSNIENINFAFANETTGAGGIFFSNAAGIPTFASGVKKITASGDLSAVATFLRFADSGATTFDGSGLSSGINGINLNSYFTVAATNPSVTIKGSAAADNLTSGGGDDAISGGAGNDFLAGNGGADSLSGDAGIDTIFGNEGNDTLNGGAGADNLTGGNGNDSYVYDDLSAGFVAANADIITGFVQGGGAGFDKLVMSASAFSGLTAGSTFVFTTALGAANAATNVIVDTAAQIATRTGVDTLSNTRLAYATDTGNWLYDGNGDWGSGSLAFTNTALLTLAGLSSANLSVV